MKRLDLNCMIGDWPFHRVRQPGFSDLKKMHAKAGIEGGLVSSTNAIFWNDPYEADRILAKELAGQSDYLPVMTVNPTLVGWRDDLDRGMKEIKPAAVRITPGFHNYSLDDAEMQALAEELVSRKLPLIITVHMEDERNTYILNYQPVPVDTIKVFADKNPELVILLANIRLGEIKTLKDTVGNRDNMFFDVSGLKDALFLMEIIEENGLLPYMVYGSMSPLFSVQGSSLHLEMHDRGKEKSEKVFAAESFMKYI